MFISENVPSVHEAHLYKSRTDLSQSENQHPWCVANFSEIVKGFGMFPNKVLQKVSKAEILQNARVDTSVPCLPSMKSQSVHTPAVLAIP